MKIDVTTRQKTIFVCLQAAFAHDFLPAIHNDGLDQQMSPLKYRIILKYGIMITLFSIDDGCPICRMACLDTFGEYVVHFRSFSTSNICMTLLEMSFLIYLGGREMKTKTSVNFFRDSLDGRSTIRQIDVKVYRWVGGKHACVDLIGFHHL